MRFKHIVLILVLFAALLSGCGNNSAKSDQPKPVTVSEKYTVVTETDIQGVYTLPVFKNIKNGNVQNQINEETMSIMSAAAVKARRERAEEIVSLSDISEYVFSEYGDYKVYCNDGEKLCFYVSVEQRFVKGKRTEFVKQNNVYNYNLKTGKKIDVAALFADKERTADYIAERLYERLFNMGCLEDETYNEAVFKNNLFQSCVIVSDTKIAVVTTAGQFNLKKTAGAPSIEISIPEEYYLKSK